jgi:undecaprenol kinase
MADRPFARSLADAADGIAATLQAQRNFRIHVTIAVVVIVAAAFLHFDSIRWALLALTIGVVLVAEVINTALEHTVDIAGAQHSSAGRAAKHAGAAAVLLAAVVAVGVGVALFGGALWHR